MRYNKFTIVLALTTPMAAAYKTICTVVATNDYDAEISCMDEKRNSEECVALASNFGNNGIRENPCIYDMYLEGATYEDLEEICTSKGGELLSYDKPLDPNDGSCIVPDL